MPGLKEKYKRLKEYLLKAGEINEAVELDRLLNDLEKEIYKNGSTLGRVATKAHYQQKEIKEKIAEREEILQATLEATDDGILVLDEFENIINSNHRFFEMWRLKIKDTTSLNAYVTIKKILFELNNPVQTYKSITRVSGSDQKLLDVLYFKDGRVFEMYSAPILKNKKRVGRVWRFKDISHQAEVEKELKTLNEELENKIAERTTDLSLSENRLKEAQEIAHLGHWLLDLKTKLLTGSENAYQIIGFKDVKKEIKLEDFLKTVHPNDLEELKQNYKNAVKQKQPFNFAHRIIKVNGEIIYLRQKCKTFYDKNGKALYSLGISQDITESKLASIAILERENQLEMALEGTGLGLWDWNMHTNEIVINRRFIQLIGHKGIIKGQKIHFDFLISIIHTDDYNRMLGSFLKYAQQGSKTFEEEFRLKRNKGDYIWIYARAKVFEWQNNKPSRSIGTFLDITDRREAEIELHKSEEKFRKLTQLSPSPICIQSIDKLLFVNPAWIEALGYSEEEALRHPFTDLVHPDNKELAVRYSKLRLYGKSAPSRYEIKMMTKANITKWFDISVTVIKYDEQMASLAVMNDITKIKETEIALRESEEKFKSLFFGNHSVMLLIDVENEQIVEANQAACNFYKYAPELIKTLPLRSLTLHSVNELKSSLNDAISGKQNLFISKHRLANGEVRDVELYSGKVKYEGKNVIYTIIHDITDRKIAEEKIRNSQKELQLLNAQKDKLFTIISHDLKGPIGNFLNFAELLKSHKELLTDETAEGIIEHSYNLANNTYRLLENLLIWAKSQLGGLKLNKQLIPLSPLVNETVKLLKENAQNKGIHIFSNIEKSVLIFADRDVVLTVLRNLISNAIKFTSKGEKITCNATKKINSAINEEFVHVSIEDTGVGIPPEKVANLFTFGAEFTTFGTDNEKGTGLGLILCKELVEQNGGEIWVESQPGIGSKFTFSIGTVPKYD